MRISKYFIFISNIYSFILNILCYFQFQLSHSSLEDLSEGSLRGLSKSLESLAIVSGRLKFIPQSTLSTLRRLKVLDFEGNQIQELGSYSFHKILLQKVSNLNFLYYANFQNPLLTYDQVSEEKSPMDRNAIFISLRWWGEGGMIKKGTRN